MNGEDIEDWQRQYLPKDAKMFKDPAVLFDQITPSNDHPPMQPDITRKKSKDCRYQAERDRDRP